jgi:hypothetical protein
MSSLSHAAPLQEHTDGTHCPCFGPGLSPHACVFSCAFVFPSMHTHSLERQCYCSTASLHAPSFIRRARLPDCLSKKRSGIGPKHSLNTRRQQLMTMLATIPGGCRPAVAGAPTRTHVLAFQRGASARTGGCGSRKQSSTCCSASSVDTGAPRWLHCNYPSGHLAKVLGPSPPAWATHLSAWYSVPRAVAG